MKPLVIDFKTLDVETFLQQYWQQKPVLLRGALAPFEDLLSPDELAGLASEPMVESRLIAKQQDKWQAQSGPFESYEHLGNKDWTLVVQAADNWSDEVAQLANAFDFLPDWRRDDVMISFATEGGSVGPHIDNYDTFICQGSGARHWRVGDKGDHQQFSAHELLLHVQSFDAIIDAELAPGDVLYIPPGYPHEGISLCPSMSFSVGYRTESAKDMLSALADFLIDHDLSNQLLSDPKRAKSQHPGLVSADDLAAIKAHLQSVLDDDALLARFAGSHLSAPKHALDAPEEPFVYDEQEIKGLLLEQPLIRLGGLRCHYLESSVEAGYFYVNGEECRLEPHLSDVIKQLCNCQQLTAELLDSALEDEGFMAFLTTLVNQGCWYFEQA